MRVLFIFLLIFSFSCSEDSVTNDPDNNGGNTGGNNNNNNSGPSGNVFTFGDIDVLGQWDFDQNRGQINNFSEPRKRDININIAQRDYDDSLDVGILSVGISPLSGELGSNEIISCVVGNYGYLPIFEDFQVSYKIAYEGGEFGEEVFETYTITDSLASVDYTYFDFATTADFSQPGSYTIEMSTHMPDDMDAETDTFTRVVESLEFTDVCNLHSLILNEDNSFNLYTTNEEGVSNYVILGDYELDEENNMIILSVTESSGSIIEIGEIYDVEIDENGLITGTINIEGLCVQLLEGYEEENYYTGLTYIPDENLEAYLIEIGIDNVLDGYIFTNSAEQVTSVGIEATDNWVQGGSIDFWDFENRFTNRLTSLAGIEALPSLQHINLRGQNLDSINISQNTGLRNFYANFNTFNKIDTSNNTLLEIISIDSNEVNPELDFSNNNNLKSLSIPMCYIDGYIGEGGYLDISNLTQLEFLDLYDNNLTSVDISNNPNLNEIRLNFTYNITTMDFSNNLLLETILLNQSNLQGTLDVSMCENLTELNVAQNPGLTCIKVSAFQLDAINNNDPNFNWEFDSGVTLSLDCN